MKMDELVKSIEDLKKRIKTASGLLKLDENKKEITELEKLTAAPDFWKNSEKAKEVSQRLNDLKDEVGVWDKLEKEAGDILDLARLDEKDQTVSLREELEKKYGELEIQFKKLEFAILFSGPYDRRNAILGIHAGTGGTEAQDWRRCFFGCIFDFAKKKVGKRR